MDFNILVIIGLTFALVVMIILYILVDRDTYKGTECGKYFLGLGAIFKNEGHILQEWIEHHRAEGFDHIYLVNDNSTDNFQEILKPYIKSGYVSLYHVPKKFRTRSQQEWAMMKIFFGKAIKDCTWFMHLDLDEFITSRDSETVRQKIDSKFKDFDFIRIPWLLFGSNEIDKTPKSAIETFTKRMKFEYNDTLPIYDNIQVKTLYRSSQIRWYFNWIRIHSPYTEGKYSLPILSKEDEGLRWGNGFTPAKESELNDYHLVINHYRLQSREFWQTQKCVRGDADLFSFLQNRTLEKFNYLNKFYNQVEDTNLRDKTSNRRYKKL